MNDGAIITREQDVIRWMLEREIVAPIEDPQDLFRHAHKLIWAAGLRLLAERRTVDYLTVRAELDRCHQLEQVGSIYLHELSRDSVRPSDAAIATAADEIKAAARTRRARAILQRHAAAEQIDIEKLASDLDALSAVHRPSPPLLDDAAVLSLPELERIVAGIPARSLVALIGDSGVGKTFVSIDLALRIPAALPWLDARIEKPGPTVYVAGEGAPAPRIGGWKVCHGFNLDEPLGMHTWSGAVSLLDPAAVSAFIGAAKPLKPVLVVLDTLARCIVGGDENSAKDMGLAVAAMDRIRVQLNATVLVLHHTTKTGATERGSSALRGACDTILHLQRADDLLQIACSKQKDGQAFDPINIKLVPAYPGAPTCVVRLATEVAADDRLTDAQGRALHVLREVFGDLGATTEEWTTAVPALSRASFYRARKVLVDTGYVRESGRRFFPTGKPPVSSSLTASLTVPDRESQAVA